MSVNFGMTGAAGGASPERRVPLRQSRRHESSVTMSGSSGTSRGEAVNGCGHVAPTIGMWVAACFPEGSASSEAQIHDLVIEAAEAARSDYGVEAALAWADGVICVGPGQNADKGKNCGKTRFCLVKHVNERNVQD